MNKKRKRKRHAKRALQWKSLSKTKRKRPLTFSQRAKEDTFQFTISKNVSYPLLFQDRFVGPGNRLWTLENSTFL